MQGCVASLSATYRELIVSKKSKQKDKNQTTEKIPLDTPWIKMKDGIIVISIASVAMAVLTAWEVIPVKGVIQGILYGLFFGGLIWLIFLGFTFFRRIIH